jgi:hypothetical protein
VERTGVVQNDISYSAISNTYRSVKTIVCRSGSVGGGRRGKDFKVTHVYTSCWTNEDAGISTRLVITSCVTWCLFRLLRSQCFGSASMQFVR